MYNSTEADNESLINESTQRTTVFKGNSPLVNIVIFLVGVVVVLCDAATCVALTRTKRLPNTTRILTCVTLVSDGTYVFVILFSLLSARLELGLDNVTVSVASEIGRVCMMISYVSIALMSLERVFCLNFGIYYSKHINKNSSHIIFVALTLAVGLKLLTRYVFIPLAKRSSFGFVANSGDQQINLCVLGLSLAVSIACYVNIYVIIRRQSQRMRSMHVHGAVTNDQIVRKTFNSTRAVSVIFAIFIAIHLPLLITLVMRQSKGNDGVARFLVLASVVTMSALNPVLYAWRFKECRYIMKSFLNKRFGLFTDSVSAMRIDIFNIVINEERSPNASTERNTGTIAPTTVTTTQ